MADNDGNISDPDQFVSAQGSASSSVADDADEAAANIVENGEPVFVGELAEQIQADNEVGNLANGEHDIALNVADGEDALLLNANPDNIHEEELLEGFEPVDSDDDDDIDDDDDDDDESFEDEVNVDEEMDEEEEEEGEEAQEGIEHPLAAQVANKISPGPGCSHYRRGCALIAPCCDKRYPCRHCHNENEQHEINRFAIAEVVCLTCEKRQPITDRCVDCAALFGNYVCLKCRVWDMDFKGQWHCDGCGICRLGGKDHFFHCDRCGYCLSVALRGDHRCIERATRTGCAICLSDLHDTRTPLVVPACGHPVHRSCWRQMIDSRRYFCPTCRRAVVDLTDIWADLDNRIGDQLNRLPAEFSLPIFCHDCQQHNSVRYNIIGYFKCPGCGSYNTQR